MKSSTDIDRIIRGMSKALKTASHEERRDYASCERLEYAAEHRVGTGLSVEE
jgi:hypothetical protein